MLAYILALIVGLGSFGLYMAAFFFPEIHRKNDFIWSGIGLFYALILWVCAGRITGGVLLGQVAGVALLGWLGWQTLTLRRQVAPPDQHTPVPTLDQVMATVSHLASPDGRSQVMQQTVRTLEQVKQGISGAIAATRQAQTQDSAPTEEIYVPPSLEDFGTAGKEAIERFAKVAIPTETESAQPTQGTTSAQPPVATSPSPNRVTDVTQNVANSLKVLTETVQALFKGVGQKKSQPIYVRKQFRDPTSDTTPDTPGNAIADITDATVISVIETVEQRADGSLVAETIVEIEQSSPSPGDLAEWLEADLASVSAQEVEEIVEAAEDIVEELLEDISAQEQAVGQLTDAPDSAHPVPHAAPLDTAIADANGRPHDAPPADSDQPG